MRLLREEEWSAEPDCTLTCRLEVQREQL